MDNEDYAAALMSAHMILRFIAVHDIPGSIEAINRAEAVGPVLDPTLYMQKRDAMAQDREVLKAALPLWELAKKWEAANPPEVGCGDPGPWVMTRLQQVIRAAKPPEPALKPCPACEGVAVQREDWAVCTVDGCEVNGPDNDPRGEKWNAMPRREP